MLTDDDIIEASEKKAALKAYHANGGAMLQNESRLKLTAADVATAIAYYLTEVVFTRAVTVTAITVQKPDYNSVGDYDPEAFDVKFSVAALRERCRRLEEAGDKMAALGTWPTACGWSLRDDWAAAKGALDAPAAGGGKP